MKRGNYVNRQRIINIAVIAHVDAGKSTLVDALLAQSGVFRENEAVVDCVMDSNELERERGITIYSKNCAIEHKGVKINIVDTPGHADFSSEVERIIRTVDTAILLVDASEGPMPQTRVVLKKALEQGLRPILFINKIDKRDQRADEVVDMTFDLFAELGADEHQLDFPILYGVARDGVAKLDPEDESSDLEPLFSLLLAHVEPHPDNREEPLQLQVSSLIYDNYLGRMGAGRITRGVLDGSGPVSLVRRDGTVEKARLGKIFVYEGLNRVEKKRVESGEIVMFSGIPDVSIGDTVCDADHPEAMPVMEIEEPTLAMNFLINSSPFAGRCGRFVTTRHIRERLARELETNVGMQVEELLETDGYRVSGRGELHLSVLLEKMRREGYELSVSKPEVILQKGPEGITEPYEAVVVTLPDEYGGTIIQALNTRKGIMKTMVSGEGRTTLEFLVPTRGLLGYRSEFLNSTRGEGVMDKSFHAFLPYAGEIPGRQNGVMVSKENGTAMAYALFNLSERGILLVSPGTEVYEGMIVGINNRNEDLVVNPCKNKQLTNVRASGSDEAVRVGAARIMTLEEALSFIGDDELVEITPEDIRLRKKTLSENARKKEKNRSPVA